MLAQLSNALRHQVARVVHLISFVSQSCSQFGNASQVRKKEADADPTSLPKKSNAFTYVYIHILHH